MSDMNENFSSFGLLWLRVCMGLGIAYHGYGKIFGGHLEQLTAGVAKLGFPQPEVFAWAAALSEFAGGLLVALGLLTRPAAFCIFVTMSVAAFVAHGSDPFSNKELALAYWTMAAALVFTGAGSFSFDGRINKK
jgi:putative oxidoreductase